MAKRREAAGKKRLYTAVIERLFAPRFTPGMTEVPFAREDIAAACRQLRIAPPKNLGDLVYSFRYRQEFNAACSCKKPGQSWGEALGPNDPTLERGDIIVTEEKAKALSQPKPEPAKGKDARKPKPGNVKFLSSKWVGMPAIRNWG